jgi:UDP-N-acetylglucosamine transferase subunit ALG13
VVFLTVGTQAPFDRLVHGVDTWAQTLSGETVKAQIGTTKQLPLNLEATGFLAPSDVRNSVKECRAVISHAGMGTILLALQFGKPLLIMPRQAKKMETRNDHQVATANRFHCFPQIVVAKDETELPEKLNLLMGMPEGRSVSAVASSELLGAIEAFISKRE